MKVSTKLHQLLACDALIVLFQISFVQQRPVPCTGLHCTPLRKAREIKDPQVLCPLHRVLCLCVLLCVSVSLCAVVCLCVSVCCVSVFCAQRWSSTPDLFALPHARRRRQRNTCFQFFSCMSAMCYCSFSSINSSQSMSGGPACSCSKSSCPGCNSTPRFITAIPSRYVYNELTSLKQRL